MASFVRRDALLRVVAEYLAESGESPDVGDDWSDSDSGSKLWNAAIVEFLLLRDFR